MVWALGRRRVCNRLIREGKAAYLAMDLASAESRLRDAYGLAVSLGTDREIAASAEQLYHVLRRKRLYDEAVPVLERLIESHQKICRPDCDDSFAWRNELIAVLACLHRNADAEAVAWRRLAAARRRYGMASVQAGLAGCTAGWAVREQGRIEEAEQLYRGALTVLETAAGPDSPVVGWALCGLAATLLRKGEVEAAGVFLGRAYANWWRIGSAELADATEGMQIDQLIAAERLPDALELSMRRLQRPRQLTEAAGHNRERQLREIEQHSFLLAATGRSDVARRYESRAQALQRLVNEQPPTAAGADDPAGPAFDSDPMIDWVGAGTPVARGC
jgi:tetratricopeptide (TPR) repeat protein